jgi:sugar-phosphatase
VVNRFIGVRPVVNTIVFDVDGVLLDSMRCYRKAWSSWGEVHGIGIDRIWALAPGRRPTDIISMLGLQLRLSTELPLFVELLNEALLAVKPMPGAADLLAALPPTWAVATSGLREQLHVAFQAAGLPLPAVTVTSEDVVAGKPAPDCYLIAARRLRVAVSHCVVVEDAPAGIIAARKAGMTCVAIATTHALSELNGADHVFPSLEAATDWLVALGRG